MSNNDLTQRTRNVMSLGALAAVSIHNGDGSQATVHIFERHDPATKPGGNTIATVQLPDASLADRFGIQLREKLSGVVPPSANEYPRDDIIRGRVRTAAKRALKAV